MNKYIKPEFDLLDLKIEDVILSSTVDQVDSVKDIFDEVDVDVL